MAANRETNRSTDDPGQQGEQWHGAHSDMQEPREPRRQPGGVQRTVDSDGGVARP